MGDQFNHIIGRHLLDSAFNGIASIASHFTAPEHENIYKGVRAAAAFMALALRKHSGEQIDDDQLSQMSIQDHINHSQKALLRSLPQEITKHYTNLQIDDEGNITNADYEKKHGFRPRNQVPLNEEGHEIRSKFTEVKTNLSEYLQLMKDKND